VVNNNPNKHIARSARLRWVPIPKTKIPEQAQREKINWGRVHMIAANLDLEQLGAPTVSLRDGWFHILDGVHRIEGLKEHGYGDQEVQCWCYEGLDEEDEAEIMLKLNDTLAVSAFDRFRIGVNAGREVEQDIDRIVRASGLVVSRDNVPGRIGAVSTLRKVYNRAGGPAMGRAVRLAHHSYGDAGLSAPVIEGFGLLCQRYNGQLDDAAAATALGAVAGGVHGLLGKAETLRRQTRNQKSHCVAAAAVEIINSKKGGKRLPSWWKSS